MISDGNWKPLHSTQLTIIHNSRMQNIQ